MKNANSRKPKFSNGLFIIFLCAIWFGIGWFFNERLDSPEVKLVENAYQTILGDSYYYEGTEDELAYSAVRGMLEQTNDPYGELLEPRAAERLEETFAGESGVIGLYADNENGQIVVQVVYPGSPAEAAGIHVGDVIVSIDGIDLEEYIDSSETGLLIRGAPGTEVDLEIRRESGNVHILVEREQREFVHIEMLSGGIGYIHLNAFNAIATENMRDGLSEVLSQNPTGLIWDLRNNEGGDMDSAQDILSFFIEDGLLFSAELTQGRVVKFPVDGEAIAAKIPLVVLIDESTYSAAETSAAAIMESNRGILIGSPSYGKGVIQATVPLADGAMLQFTIARWVSANGEWYQDRGVPPNIEVFDRPETNVDEVVEMAIEVLLNGQ